MIQIRRYLGGKPSGQNRQKFNKKGEIKMKTKNMVRRILMFLVCVMVLLSASACKSKDNKGLKKLVISEPMHMIGYLPLYVAESEGYFAEEGIKTEVVSAGGGTHVTMVISGDAWGSIGGPESNAMSNAKGDSPEPLVSFVNCVNRANVYMLAAKGTSPADDSDKTLATYMKGKRIIAGRYGGTPNLLVRSLLIRLGLNPEKDVTLLEPADGGTTLALMQQGQADIAQNPEPAVRQGIVQGVWDEPFYKFHSLGDCSYSVLSTRKSTIEKDPETVQKFTNAIVKALKKVTSDRDFALACAKKEFPTMADEDLQAAIDRAYEDKLWSPDGYISKEGLDTDMNVMIVTGLYTGTYTYDELIDMTFVNKANGK